MTGHHHQPQLWLLIFVWFPHKSLPPWSLTASFTPEKLLGPNWKVHLPTKKRFRGYIYVKLHGVYPFLFLTHPAKKLKKPNPNFFFSGSWNSRTDYSPEKTKDWNLKISPKPKRKNSLKKNTAILGFTKCYFSKGKLETNLRLSWLGVDILSTPWGGPDPSWRSNALKRSTTCSDVGLGQWVGGWRDHPTEDFGGENRPYHL